MLICSSEPVSAQTVPTAQDYQRLHQIKICIKNNMNEPARTIAKKLQKQGKSICFFLTLKGFNVLFSWKYDNISLNNCQVYTFPVKYHFFLYIISRELKIPKFIVHNITSSVMISFQSINIHTYVNFIYFYPVFVKEL